MSDPRETFAEAVWQAFQCAHGEGARPLMTFVSTVVASGAVVCVAEAAAHGKLPDARLKAEYLELCAYSWEETVRQGLVRAVALRGVPRD